MFYDNKSMTIEKKKNFIINSIYFALIIAIVFIVIKYVLGTGGVVVPWIIIELIKGNVPLAIGLAVLYLIIIIVRNILEPKLVGKQIGLHPLVIGLKVFGLIGILALPVTVVIIKHLYDNDFFKQ